MKLPRFAEAVVPEKKVVSYLLSMTHRDGRHKAVFFTRFGFDSGNWQSLRDALLEHAATHEVARIEPSLFGIRYVVEGTMNAPDGRTPRLRTVWFCEKDGDAPMFVTAYPL